MFANIKINRLEIYRIATALGS